MIRRRRYFTLLTAISMWLVFALPAISSPNFESDDQAISELVSLAKDGADFEARKAAVEELLELDSKEALFGLIEVAQYHISRNHLVSSIIDNPQRQNVAEVVKARALQIVEPGLGRILGRFDRAVLVVDHDEAISALDLLWQIILDQDMPRRYRRHAFLAMSDYIGGLDSDDPAAITWAAKVKCQMDDDLASMANLALASNREVDFSDYDNADVFERLLYFAELIEDSRSEGIFGMPTEAQWRLAINASLKIIDLDTDHVTEWHAANLVLQRGTADDWQKLILCRGVENDSIKQYAREKLAS